jgi:uncharacterized membrane protein HdeD (DUF308 family)
MSAVPFNQTASAAPFVHEGKTVQFFVVRGLIAVVWAALFAAASNSLTTGVTVGVGILLVVYPLIDVVASLIDARSQRGPARRVLLAGAALSTVAAVALAVAAAVSVAAALAVFGVWAVVSGAAQLVTALRRRTLLGNQWPMLAAGGFSVLAGIAFVLMAAGDDPQLGVLAIYAASGGIDFMIEAALLVRRNRRLPA